MYVSSKSPALNPLNGSEYFIALLLLGLVSALSLWEKNTFLALVIIAGFGGFGAYLWQKPRKLYRCTKCGSEYYGKNLTRYRK